MFDIPAQCKALKLYGMASCYTELKQQTTPDQIANLEWADQMLSQLLQAESTERNIRSIRFQTQAARFPIQRHLQGFDFSQSNDHESIASPRMMKDNGVAVYSCQKSFNFLEL